jgi:hypothetical protein
MNQDKLVRLTKAQMSELEQIKSEIKKNGGYCSANQLIRDSIQIFLKQYRDKAIQNYSPAYD